MQSHSQTAWTRVVISASVKADFIGSCVTSCFRSSSRWRAFLMSSDDDDTGAIALEDGVLLRCKDNSSPFCASSRWFSAVSWKSNNENVIQTRINILTDSNAARNSSTTALSDDCLLIAAAADSWRHHYYKRLNSNFIEKPSAPITAIEQCGFAVREACSESPCPRKHWIKHYQWQREEHRQVWWYLNLSRCDWRSLFSLCCNISRSSL